MKLVSTERNCRSIAITLIEGGQPPSGVNECNRLFTSTTPALECISPDYDDYCN
jgi:hypothetical protein